MRASKSSGKYVRQTHVSMMRKLMFIQCESESAAGLRKFTAVGCDSNPYKTVTQNTSSFNHHKYFMF